MPPSDIAAEPVLDLLARLLHIPDAARRFTATEQEAWELYRVDAPLLVFLRAHGLPVERRDRTAWFDRTDLINIGNYLGSSTATRASRRFWAAACNRSADQGPVEYELRYEVRCPEPGHAGACEYRFVLPDGREVETVTRAGGPPEPPAVRVSLEVAWPPLPPAARDLLAVVAGLRFMRLPRALHGDLDFVRRTGLADCWGTAGLLAAEGRQRGLPVRSSFGLIVVAPYSTVHCFAEVRVDRRWVPVDPVLVNAMLEWGVLDPLRWDPYRPLGSLFLPIAPDEVELAVHNGQEIAVSVATRRTPTAR